MDLFLRVYEQLYEDGYFQEAFGYKCVDSGFVPGTVRDPDLAIFLAIRKRDLWPIQKFSSGYSEDDLFDMIEFLFQHVSKPTEGWYHNWSDCGYHWNKFAIDLGQVEFCEKMNVVLGHYESPFELSPNGEVLRTPDQGFETILAAELPSKDANVHERVAAAVLKFRRHGSTPDDRRDAVRDLADVLEYLRPHAKDHLSSKDEGELFNIANNFGIRHHNPKQKTKYDAGAWLNWMFYIYLATIHVLVRKMDEAGRGKGAVPAGNSN